MHSLGRRFAHALAEKDTDQLHELIASDVDFRGLTPMKFWEAQDHDELIDIMLGTWFAPDEHIDAILDLNENDSVEDTAHVSYRFAVTTPDGTFTAEQQAYYRVADEKIAFLRVLCSGFRPVPD